jgi:large subunit ribosomal protein L16
MFEIGGVDQETATEALRLASYKLPVKCKVVPRIDPISGQGVA